MSVSIKDEYSLALTSAHLFVVDPDLYITALHLPVITSKASFPTLKCNRKLFHRALIYVCS